MRPLAAFLVASVFSAGLVLAETPVPESRPVPTGAEPEKAWSFSISAYGYFVPEDDDYVQPTFTADRKRLHLEARWNYEDLETGSVWAGCNFGGGETVEWELTAMLGGVFGETEGVAPGYKGSVAWKKLEFYSEGEYVFDTGDEGEDFFYNWSELTLAPVDWFRFGLVTQRVRTYETGRDIQRGLLLGFSWEDLDIGAYVFNPDDSDPLVVVSLALSF